MRALLRLRLCIHQPIIRIALVDDRANQTKIETIKVCCVIHHHKWWILIHIGWSDSCGCTKIKRITTTATTALDKRREEMQKRQTTEKRRKKSEIYRRNRAAEIRSKSNATNESIRSPAINAPPFCCTALPFEHMNFKNKNSHTN